MPSGAGWVFQPKYHTIAVIALVLLFVWGAALWALRDARTPDDPAAAAATLQSTPIDVTKASRRGFASEPRPGDAAHRERRVVSPGRTMDGMTAQPAERHAAGMTEETHRVPSRTRATAQPDLSFPPAPPPRSSLSPPTPTGPASPLAPGVAPAMPDRAALAQVFSQLSSVTQKYPSVVTEFSPPSSTRRHDHDDGTGR